MEENLNELLNSSYYTNHDISDSLNFYLYELYNYPVLTKEEEKEYALKIQAGDVEATRILIERNLRLVVNIAKRYMNRGLDLLDLISEGNIGLMEAVKKYDINKGYRFSTFAFYYIRQKIRIALLEKSKNIKISSYHGEILVKYYKTREKLNQLLKREVTIDEIALEMNVSSYSLNKLLTYNLDTLSLDTKIINQKGQEVELRRIIKDNKNYEKMILDKIANTKLREIILDNLDQREIEIIKNRYLSTPIKTYKEIGEILGLSRERVRQLEFIALNKLKHSDLLRDYLNDEIKQKRMIK